MDTAVRPSFPMTCSSSALPHRRSKHNQTLPAPILGCLQLSGSPSSPATLRYTQTSSEVVFDSTAMAAFRLMIKSSRIAALPATFDPT